LRNSLDIIKEESQKYGIKIHYAVKANSNPRILQIVSSYGFGADSHPEIARVALDQAKTAFDNKSALFIDVRPASEYASAHIPGALNIPLGEIATRLNELDPNQWIICYCT